VDTPQHNPIDAKVCTLGINGFRLKETKNRHKKVFYTNKTSPTKKKYNVGMKQQFQHYPIDMFCLQ